MFQTLCQCYKQCTASNTFCKYMQKYKTEQSWERSIHKICIIYIYLIFTVTFLCIYQKAFTKHLKWNFWSSFTGVFLRLCKPYQALFWCLILHEHILPLCILYICKFMMLENRNWIQYIMKLCTDVCFLHSGGALCLPSDYDIQSDLTRTMIQWCEVFMWKAWSINICL